MGREHSGHWRNQGHSSKSTGNQPAQNPSCNLLPKCLIRCTAKLRILPARNQVVVGRATLRCPSFTPAIAVVSDIAILRQSSSLNSESKRGEPLLAFVIPAIRSF